MAQERIHQLDYLKGIFILLMVLFHLALIEETYPVLREAVYTFHMSAFLIISGYLANVDKEPRAFGKSLLRILVPYLLFEALYILLQYFMGHALHAHNAIERLTAMDFVTRIATQPTGPYWYLHTLVICTIIYWLVYRVLKLNGISGLALSGLVLYGLSLVIEGLHWDYIIYFLIGMFIMRSGYALLKVITPSFIAALPLIVLFAFRENYQNGSLAGVAITVLMMSLLLALYPYCFKVLRDGLCYIGRNSLAIVVFSPIFTILTKMAAPYFSFDPSAACFAVVAVVFVVICCLACAYLSDKLKISRYIFLKDKFYRPYKVKLGVRS
ncbi:MAG: acyltransferase family protein [Muribaculaceae bacterium]|nr:acyltransferase family protein [Muribaculaceae bacterium]